MTDALWTTVELAAYLRISEATIRTQCSRSPERLPPRVVGMANVRWHPSTVQAWAQRVAQQARVGRKRRVTP